MADQALSAGPRWNVLLQRSTCPGRGRLLPRRHKLALPPLVGFDDAPIAETLNLTTIAIPWDELIDGVVRVVKRRLAGDRATSSHQVFNPRPILRGFASQLENSTR